MATHALHPTPISSDLLDERFADPLAMNKALFGVAATERDLDLLVSALHEEAGNAYSYDVEPFVAAVYKVATSTDVEARLTLKKFILCVILTQHKSTVGAGAVAVIRRSYPKIITFVRMMRAFTNQLGAKHLNMDEYVRRCQYTYMML